MSFVKTNFEGYEAYELLTPSLRLVAVTQFGPRIAFFGPREGRNLLWWAPEKASRKGWYSRGGHRIWVARPMADEAEETYAPDNAPCEATPEEDCLTLWGGPHEGSMTRRGMRIRLLDERTVTVTGLLKNEGDMLYSGGLWGVTCTLTENRVYGVPLGSRGLPFDLVRLIIPRSWAGHKTRVTDPQYILNEEFLKLIPSGEESKRMLLTPCGAVAMACPDAGVTFVKSAPYQEGLPYPQGANIALYTAPERLFCEMELMNPERMLQPGQILEGEERWQLLPQVCAFESDRELALFR